MNRAYTLWQVSVKLNVHIRTVQDWVRQGLVVFNMPSRPYKVMGRDVHQFLIKKQRRLGRHLEDGEFMCLTCHAPRYPSPDNVAVIQTGYRMGPDKIQVRLQGRCQDCGRDSKIVDIAERAIALYQAFSNDVDLATFDKYKAAAFKKHLEKLTHNGQPLSLATRVMYLEICNASLHGSSSERDIKVVSKPMLSTVLTSRQKKDALPPKTTPSRYRTLTMSKHWQDQSRSSQTSTAGIGPS